MELRTQRVMVAGPDANAIDKLRRALGNIATVQPATYESALPVARQTSCDIAVVLAGRGANTCAHLISKSLPEAKVILEQAGLGLEGQAAKNGYFAIATPEDRRHSILQSVQDALSAPPHQRGGMPLSGDRISARRTPGSVSQVLSRIAAAQAHLDDESRAYPALLESFLALTKCQRGGLYVRGGNGDYHPKATSRVASWMGTQKIARDTPWIRELECGPSLGLESSAAQFLGEARCQSLVPLVGSDALEGFVALGSPWLADDDDEELMLCALAQYAATTIVQVRGAQRHAQRDLLYRRSMATLAQAFAVVDVRGVIMDWNDPGEALSSPSGHRIVGQHYRALRNGRIKNLISQALRSRDGVRLACRALTAAWDEPSRAVFLWSAA